MKYCGWRAEIPVHYADGTSEFPYGCSSFSTKKDAEIWAREMIEALDRNDMKIVECQRLYPEKPIFQYIKKSMDSVRWRKSNE